MKSFFLYIFFACFFTDFAFAQDTAGVKVLQNKSDIPSVNIKTTDGAVFNTSQFSNDGKPVIISFWATWCVNCIKELKAINEVYADWQDSTGVKLIAVSVDDAKSADKVKPFVNGRSWDYEVYLDVNKDFFRAMNVVSVPYTLVIDGNGKIVWQHVSYTEGDEDILFKVVKQVASGHEITE